jgi:hypothetical protein
MEKRILKPKKKGNILTDGKAIYGELIDLAEGVDASTFHEITREEYEDILSKQEET